MATWNSDGSLTDVNLKIGLSSNGDIVTVPAGSFTWGASGSAANINKQITLQGAGVGVTTITTHSASSSNGMIQINAANVTVRDLTTIPYNGRMTFATNGANFRITNVEHNPTSVTTSGTGYFLFVNKVFGRVDHCTITGGSTTNELIFGRGPDDAWDTPYVPGTANCVRIETCTFNGPGYVCDANSNAMFTVRFNVITGPMKIDGHGFATNSERGVRALEAYGNTWTHTSGSSWAAVEARGGVNYIWGNAAASASANLGYFRLTDYGCTTSGTIFSRFYQTPNSRPIPDQVGAGPGTVVPNGFGTQVAGAQPSYVFNNTKGGVAAGLSWRSPVVDEQTRSTDSVGYAIGESVIGTTGADVYAGNYIAFANQNKRYLITSGNTNSPGNITISPPLEVALPASVTVGKCGMVQNYQGEENDHTVTCVIGPTSPGVILRDQDYFQSITPFTGASGVGSGTFAEMSAITPSLVGVAFWVTDRGNWNADADPDTSGELYIWDGSAWELSYTPYTYSSDSATTPHILAASVDVTGNVLTVNLSEACEIGAGGTSGLTLDASGDDIPLTYIGGAGTATFTFGLSRPALSIETLTTDYVQPGDGIESVADQTDLDNVTDQHVSNNSLVGVDGIIITTLNVGTLVLG